MGCVSGNKVLRLPWKDQANALKAPLNQTGNVFYPFMSFPVLPIAKLNSGTAMAAGVCSTLCLQKSAALQINYFKPFL